MKIKQGSLERVLAYDKKYIGLAELAKILDMTKQATVNWKTRGHTPKPLIDLAMGPIWTHWQICKWIEAN